MDIKANNRNFGIDLLRIVCMFMVCSIHIEAVVRDTSRSVVEDWLNCLLRIMCICAVNCYALISGYVGVNSKHKCRNLISLWITVAFYSVLFAMITRLVHPESITIGEIAKSFFPVLNIKYWYFSSYFALFLFMPLVNEFVQIAEKKQKLCVLAGVLIVASGSTLLNALNDLWSTNHGYSVVWLLCMYYMGALLKKHMIKRRIPWLLVYGITIITAFGIKVSVQYCNLLKSVLGDAENLLAYTSPLIIISAVSLFMFFANLNVGKGYIRFIKFVAPLSFSVYLIHYDKQVWGFLTEAINKI